MVKENELGEEKPLVFEDEASELKHRFYSKEHIKSYLSTYLVTLEFELYKGFKSIEYTTSEYDERLNYLF